jgi:hypothetical protein
LAAYCEALEWLNEFAQAEQDTRDEEYARWAEQEAEDRTEWDALTARWDQEHEHHKDLDFVFTWLGCKPVKVPGHRHPP